MVDKPDIRDSDDKFLYDLRHDPTGEIATLTARLETAEKERDEAVELLRQIAGLHKSPQRSTQVAKDITDFLNPQQRPVKTNEEGEGG